MKKSFALGSIISLYFLFGFVTAMNDILIPHLKSLFQLSNLESMLVQFCFFGAYFIMSVPAGWFLTKTGFKKGLVSALCIVGLGLWLFIPASEFKSYPLFLFALFIIGSGITVLQVAANPYLSILGPMETAAKRLNLAGFVNSFATTIAPIIGSYFLFNAMTDSNIHSGVQIPYACLGLFVFLLSFSLNKIDLPSIEKELEEVGETSSIWQHKNLILGSIGIFFYVGVEVATGSMLIGFLETDAMGNLNAEKASVYVSYYWGLTMVGRLIGFLLGDAFSPKKMLQSVSVGAMILVLVAIFTKGNPAILSLVALGLMNSVMWPCIFPMAIKGLGPLTSKGSGLLISMVVGGALYPLLIGKSIDMVGYSTSFWWLFLGYGYILFFGIVASSKENANTLKPTL